MSTKSSNLSRLLAVTALAGGLALAGPAFAATSSSTVSPVPNSAAAPKHQKTASADGVEAHIKALHDKLQITPDQEDSWSTVAQAMRDNESNMKSMWQERRDSGETRSAVEDLESFQKLKQAEADGLGKVADAFGPLYNGMSDDQKKNADEVFGRWEGHRDSSGKPGSSKSPS